MKYGRDVPAFVVEYIDRHLHGIALYRAVLEPAAERLKCWVDFDELGALIVWRELQKATAEALAVGADPGDAAGAPRTASETIETAHAPPDRAREALQQRALMTLRRVVARVHALEERAQAVLDFLQETGQLLDPDQPLAPRCTRARALTCLVCGHRGHTGTCTRRSGGTAYACGCTMVTLDERCALPADHRGDCLTAAHMLTGDEAGRPRKATRPLRK